MATPTPEVIEDTIVASSTPPGRGGIGIVRLDGPDALSIASQLLQIAAPLEHARARFVRIPDPQASGQVIDEAVVTAFLAPHSYTGGNVVEIAAHGSPVILEALVHQALSLGARLAAPGEFTQRAFLSGRLDLTQAEAVHDLIAAQTIEQARVAAQQMGGAMSRRVAPAKESLLHLITLLEAGMDFASGELDDVDVVDPQQVASLIQSAREPLEILANTFRSGQMLRQGASLALVGRPNAGKSSLFNRLLDRERAIVTPIPGTTRDTIEESIAVGGIPLRLIDTAGLRLAGDQTTDVVEQQGIARSLEALADADIVILTLDTTVRISPDEEALAARLSGRPHLVVWNKIDLAAPPSGAGAVAVSALTGEGIDSLMSLILRELRADGALAAGGALNNSRQQEAVMASLKSLAEAAEASRTGLPHELILLDLHNALRSLDSLTGATTTDDILSRIFSAFCIGK
jgi:tRNA modification GTPase